MVDNNLLVIAAAVLLGFFWLTVWLIKKIRRGEIGVSASSALLLLVAALLLVPFAMNFSAHLISQVMHHKGGTEDGSPKFAPIRIEVCRLPPCSHQLPSLRFEF